MNATGYEVRSSSRASIRNRSALAGRGALCVNVFFFFFFFFFFRQTFLRNYGT